MASITHARQVNSYLMIKDYKRSERRREAELDLMSEGSIVYSEWDSVVELRNSNVLILTNKDSYCDELGETILASMAYKKVT